MVLWCTILYCSLSIIDLFIWVFVLIFLAGRNGKAKCLPCNRDHLSWVFCLGLAYVSVHHCKYAAFSNSLWMVQNFKIARNTGNIAKQTHRLLKLFILDPTEWYVRKRKKQKPNWFIYPDVDRNRPIRKEVNDWYVWENQSTPTIQIADQ